MIVDARERAAEKVEWDEPASADPVCRSVERHELPVDRRQWLAGRQDDRPAAGVDGERAFSRIFSDVELEQRREIVEGDCFAALDADRFEWLASLRRNQRQLAGRRLGAERKQADGNAQGRDGQRQGASGANGRRSRRVKHGAFIIAPADAPSDSGIF